MEHVVWMCPWGFGDNQRLVRRNVSNVDASAHKSRRMGFRRILKRPQLVQRWKGGIVG